MSMNAAILCSGGGMLLSSPVVSVPFVSMLHRASGSLSSADSLMSSASSTVAVLRGGSECSASFDSKSL